MNLPAAISISVHGRCESAHQLVGILTSATESSGFGPVIQWWAGEAEQRGTHVDLLRAIETEGNRDRTGFSFVTSKGDMDFIVGFDAGAFDVSMTAEASDDAFDVVLPASAQLIRQLAPHVESARVLRQNDGGCFWPDPPIAESFSLVVRTRREIEDAYEDITPFWGAWDNIEEFGDLVLVTRGLDMLDRKAWMERIFDDQWRMARTAKPGLTEYYDPDPDPWQMELYNAGETVLRQVCYSPSQKLIEYAGDPNPGQHIPVREFFEIREFAESGRTADGEPVETVRVVFHTREQAEAEKRPLLDCGIRVFYMGASGEDVEITD